MTQERLVNLAIMSIESNILREKGVWPLNLDFVLDAMTWRYYMRDPYTDNNLIDYYTQNYIQFCYLLVTRPAI